MKNKKHNENTLRLMLTNIGCLIMNCGYFLVLLSNNDVEATTALKLEYLGDTLFYLFFLLFLKTYMKWEISKTATNLWIAFECMVVCFFWVDEVRDAFIGKYAFTNDNFFSFYTTQISPGVLYVVRYGSVIVLLLAALIGTIKRIFSAKLKSDSANYARLAGAEGVVLLSLVLQVTLSPDFNIVPMFASLSTVFIIFSVISYEFFGVMDSGHEWIFEQMENAYIIVDSTYGYLDSNKSAKKLFSVILECQTGKFIPDSLYEVFTSKKTNIVLRNRIFEKKVTELKSKGIVVGYGLLLEDVTLMHNYNARLKREVAEKTEHLQLVQDSIITGMASVVESSDNSTGGHINRTRLVVRVFSKKLLEHASELGIDETFVNNVVKAAPMHDIGKIAVDDAILRKPGKYTDEEFEQMKRHTVEGGRMLEKILREVDDVQFNKIAINVAKYHHERFDGTGYPSGVSGKVIPLEARIMALADVFDALVSQRYYKEAFTYDKVFAIMEEGLGTQFDPVLGELFLECRPSLERLYDKMKPS